MYSRKSWGGQVDPYILVKFRKNPVEGDGDPLVSLVMFEWNDEDLIGRRREGSNPVRKKKTITTRQHLTIANSMMRRKLSATSRTSKQSFVGRISSDLSLSPSTQLKSRNNPYYHTPYTLKTLMQSNTQSPKPASTASAPTLSLIRTTAPSLPFATLMANFLPPRSLNFPFTEGSPSHTPFWEHSGRFYMCSIDPISYLYRIISQPQSSFLLSNSS